jgi:pantoate--beta-alanine ligase
MKPSPEEAGPKADSRMETLHDIPALRSRLAGWRAAGLRIALVPTMGNLHEGHIALVRTALAGADRVVATVFVNPLQFGPGEDLHSYPRTLAEDARQLQAVGCQLLFAPSEATMYPQGRAGHTQVEVPGLSAELCGASRPGHFRGVTTVVAKLFNLVQPDLAVFGQKDYQQLMLIRRMALDLNMDIEIVGLPTVREADGLAMSSRNAYLTAAERARAPMLFRTLTAVAAAVAAGTSPEQAERDAAQALRTAGFEPDYVSVRRRVDLALPGPADSALVVLAAAHLGRARLIDNLELDRPLPVHG